MLKKPFFSAGAATDVTYTNVRDLDNEYASAARANCEQLWELFEPYADPEFLIEIRSNFAARYWEMYLTSYFLMSGFDISCPKPGPDVGIEYEGQRIWFEATSPTRGADGSPDQVPDQTFGVVQNTPNKQMILRYLSSISGKYNEQYRGWLRNDTIGPDDAFVVAINPRRLMHEWGDTQPPRILQAAFYLGDPYVVWDTGKRKAVESGYNFRDSIVKASGAAVATGVFHIEEYRQLSGLLCSRIDVTNQPRKMGDDFQLVPNPNATNSLPALLRLAGTYFRVHHSEGTYSVIPESEAKLLSL